MATWQVIAGGTTYNLSDRNPFDVVTVTGTGSAPVRRMSQRGPLQHGETDIGYRLDPRSINLVLAFAAASLSAADTHRDTLARIFRPTDTPIQLRYTRDDAAVRQIDCYAVGMVDMPVTVEERVGVFQRVAIQLVAPDPAWYNPSINTAALANSPENIFSASGMIAAANVKHSVTHPAVGDGMGTETFDDGAFTIYARTTLDNDADAISNLFSIDYYFPVGGAHVAISFGYAAGSSNRQELSIVLRFVHNVAFMSGGLHNYFFVYDGSTIRVYEDNTMKYEAVLVFQDGAVIRLALSRWRGESGSEWDHDVTHGAIYSKALTAEERSAIISMVSTPTYSLGVVNSGSFNEYPIIVLAGPLVNPKIENKATGEILDFTGTTIAANTTYTIDTRYSKKSVTDPLGVNKIAALTNDSDLSTFHLIAGTNPVIMTATGTDANSGATFYYYNRYLSL